MTEEKPTMGEIVREKRLRRLRAAERDLAEAKRLLGAVIFDAGRAWPIRTENYRGIERFLAGPSGEPKA